MICGPLPDAKLGVLSEEYGNDKEYCGAGTRSCASTKPVHLQRGGQRNQRRKRGITCAKVRTGGFWATTPPPAHIGRSFDVSRWKVGRIAPGAKSCEDTRSARESLNRSWQVPQNWERSARFLWSNTSKPTVPTFVYSNECQGVSSASCRDESLAIMQPL